MFSLHPSTFHASPPHSRPALVPSPISRSSSLLDDRRRRGRQRQQQQEVLTRPRALPTIPAANNQLRVSILGLGTWSWGNRFLYGYETTQDEGIARAFKAAVDAGITLWDSADSYGTGALSGRAESLLGQFLSDRSLCSSAYRERQVVAATKIAPYPWRITGKMFENAASASVQRLSGQRGGKNSPPTSSSSPSSSSPPLLLLPPSRVVIQLHWSAANYAPPQEAALWDGLSRCYDSGLCSAVGVSNFGPRQLEKISKFLTKRGIPLAVAQNQYSLLSCGPATEAAISAARDAGAIPLAYSPLALGMLSGRYSVGRRRRRPRREEEGDDNDDDKERRRRSLAVDGDDDDGGGKVRLPSGPRGVLFKQILPGARGLLDAIDAVAAETQVAIAWCVSKRTVPIPGARTADDVRSHVAAATARLPPGAVEELDSAARRVERGMTTNVFQTR